MILLTGASGYIGQRLLPSLQTLKGSGAVITAGRDASSCDRPLDLHKVSDYGDVTNGVETLIHCAGLAHNSATNEDYERINVQASLALADAALATGVRRFIYISSMNVVDPGSRNPHTAITALPCPTLPYAASKWRAERELEALLSRSSCELHIIRPALVYDRQLTGNLAALAAIAQFIPARFPEAGHRSMICREDLVSAISAIVATPFGSLGVHRYGVWDGQCYSAGRIADAIVGVRRIRLPHWLWQAAAALRDIGQGIPLGTTWSAIGVDHWVAGRGVEPLFKVAWQLESRLVRPPFSNGANRG